MGLLEKTEGISLRIGCWMSSVRVLSRHYLQWRGLRVSTRALPKPVLARLLHHQDREIVMCLSRERPNSQNNGVKVSFYLNFSAEVQHQRAKFFYVKQCLRRLGLSYAMLYPAHSRVTANGQAIFFNAATDAADWLMMEPMAAALCKPPQILGTCRLYCRGIGII